MRTVFGIALLIALAAGPTGCKQEVLSETYRPIGVGGAAGRGQPMAAMMPVGGHVRPAQNLPRRAGTPWYKFEWLFGRERGKRSASGMPPVMKPSQPVRVGVPN